MPISGMFLMELYDRFSETDTTKFEDQLIRWTRKPVPKPVLFFNKSRLKVGKISKIDNSDFLYQVELPRLCMQCICINEDMCILLKVTRTDGENNRIIYKIPNSWSGTSPWYAD